MVRDPGKQPSIGAVAFAAALSVCALPIQADAQEIASRGRGQQLAQQLCAECHAIDKGDEASPLAEAPTFPTVAATPGATAKLYAQAKNGAPFQVFLSADHEHVDRLCAEGVGVGETRFVYATGKLALYSAREPVRDGALLRGDTVKHLAIANPAVAPYGAAAVAALKALGLWDALAPRIVQGENIAQTHQFIESGAAEAGFVAWSQVLKAPADRVWLLPQDLYPPLVQEAVLLAPGKDKPAATAYLAYLKTDAARALITATGYAWKP